MAEKTGDWWDGDLEMENKNLVKKESHSKANKTRPRKNWSGDWSQSRGHTPNETIPRWELSPAAGS